MSNTNIILGDLITTSVSATTYYNLPSSGISGSGSTGQITFFNSSSSLSGSSQLNWDDTNRVLRILGNGGSGTASWLQVTNGASGITPGDGMLIGYGTDNNARISLQDANSLILSNSSGDALVLNTGNVSSVNNHIIGGPISSLNTGTRFQIESPGSGSSDYPFRVNGLASSKIHFMNGVGQVGIYKSNTTLGAILDISSPGSSSNDVPFRIVDDTNTFDILTTLGNGNFGINTSNPSERLEVSGKTKTISLQVTSGATNNYVLTSDSNGNATWQPATITTLSSTTATIHFTGNTVFGTYSSPISSNLTDTLTEAKLGVVQKIYHNSGTAPTVPVGWVLLGSTTYQTSTVNIIYAEWSEGTRVEYWIVR